MGRRGRAIALLGAAVVMVAAPACSAPEGGELPPGQPMATISQDVAAPTEPWPSVTPRAAGFDPARLRAVLRDARGLGTTCLAVVREGRLVADRYWNGGAPEDAVAGFSVTKSITSTLVGIAESAGLLDIDDPAARYVPEWRGTPAAAVTVRHLLSNDSGREHSRASDYAGLIRARDRTAYAVGLGQEHPPGTVWTYNNAAIQTLDQVLRTATGEDAAAYAERVLFEPLGMTHSRLTGDASRRSTSTAFGLESTCLDLAAFGQTFLQHGRWQGIQVVPRGWVQDAVGGPSQELNRSYGLLWWVNADGLVPGAPPEVFAALGFGGQVVLVDPVSQTVVVRLGAVSAEYSVRDAARVITEASRS